MKKSKILWIIFINFIFIILFLIYDLSKNKSLVGVGETTHTRHDTEDIVVNGIDINVGVSTIH